MAIGARRIEVHVDRIVLHDVPPGDRPRAIEALRERLADIAARPDVHGADSHALERLDGGTLGRKSHGVPSGEP